MKRNFFKILLVAILVFSITSLSAKSVVEIYRDGGVFMHLITLMAVIMIILAIIKYWQLSIKEKLDTKSFYLKLKGYIKNNQYEEAIKICKQFSNTTMGFIFWNGLLTFVEARKSGKKGAELQQALQNAFDEAGLQTIPKIEKNLFWLDIIAQVSTLLGLLGTIFGLIKAFDGLANALPSEQSKILTSGISMAMGTTAYGLIVAIPTLFVKGALQARADKIINAIDEYSVKMINQIVLSNKE